MPAPAPGTCSHAPKASGARTTTAPRRKPAQGSCKGHAKHGQKHITLMTNPRSTPGTRNSKSRTGIKGTNAQPHPTAMLSPTEKTRNSDLVRQQARRPTPRVPSRRGTTPHVRPGIPPAERRQHGRPARSAPGGSGGGRRRTCRHPAQVTHIPVRLLDVVNSAQNYLLIFVRAQRTAAPLAETSRSSPGAARRARQGGARSRRRAQTSQRKPHTRAHARAERGCTGRPAPPTVRLERQDQLLLAVQLLVEPVGRLQTCARLRQLGLRARRAMKGGNTVQVPKPYASQASRD